MTRRRRVTLDAVRADSSSETLVLDYPSAPPYVVRVWRGTDPDPASYPATDLFAALLQLRLDLEADGLLLCCQGARGDVTSSGMERQAGGHQVFPFTPATREVRHAEAVDIFAPAAPDQVVTVEEQRRAVFALHGLTDDTITRHPGDR
ncbi:hypothetical protein RM844_30020 [Streptomyces sp. DSM 44915]|uniref:Uncharacterized protein n=1 Tax=Streptomyces chisholmiae TaxID=3075540 RepID=A0ABU2K0B5_9ACTN|nr:hypothetical protein [Streptomyces sp. DSM 44915]MDT0270517.1 hypothetical protein [Streptomyces sp. DSM 44915]